MLQNEFNRKSRSDAALFLYDAALFFWSRQLFRLSLLVRF
jgi:hypothetical protein